MLMILVFMTVLSIVVSTDKIVPEKAPIATPIKYDTKVSTFGFTVEGEHTWLSTQVGISIVNYVVKMDFNESEWKDYYNKISTAWTTFENNGAFADSTLKSEYISLSNSGFEALKDTVINIQHMLIYKNMGEKVPESKCVIELGSINKLEMERTCLHLEKALTHIKSTWTATDVKADLDKRQVLMEFIDVYNTAMLDLNLQTRNIIGTLEALSEGNFPIEVLGPKRSCHVSTSIEGEVYDIISCGGNKDGYTCRVEVTQPLALLEVYLIHPISYDGWSAVETNSSHLLVKDKLRSVVKLMHCTVMGLIHPICQEWE